MARKSLAHSLPLLILIVTTFLGGCGGNDTNDRTTNLRFVNAVEGFASVDMSVDADEYLSDIAYLESTDYLEFDTDPHLLQITPSNSLTPIDTLRVSLADNFDYTYFACGNSADPAAILLQDDNQPAGDTSFRARVVNLFKSELSFDVYVVGVSGGDSGDSGLSGAPTVRGSSFKAASGYSVGRAGGYVISVTATGSKQVLARLTGQEFKGRGVYSILLVSEASAAGQAEAGASRKVGVRVLGDRG